MKMTTKKCIALCIALMMLAAMAACGATNQTGNNSPEELPTVTEATAEPAVDKTQEPAQDTPSDAVAEPETTPEPTAEPVQTVPVRVAALTGPTGVGLAYLKDASPLYDLELFTEPTQVVAKFTSGEIDIAAVPINLAATLYKKLNGDVVSIAVNTLGVLYFVENGNTIADVADLAGKTIYATGQASTPQYILEKILADYGLTDSVTVEYVAEAAQLAAQLAENNDVTIAFLPEPMVSVACAKSETVRVALSANELWTVRNDVDIVQGVYVVRRAFLESNKAAVEQFVLDARSSVTRVLSDENAAEKVVELGVIGQVPIARRAIPNCNIVFITGGQMKELVSAMLETLYHANPKSVGGELPSDDFYYIP